jgi:Protein of unknown function (DUF3562)
MKDESLAIGEQTLTPPVNANADIELLSRETHTPRALVATLYAAELAKLEKNARIKTYIPVLIHRHVKALLREQARA